MNKIPQNHLRAQLLVAVTDPQGRCVVEHVAVVRDFAGVEPGRVAAEIAATFKESLRTGRAEAGRD
jgi:hypothetical protein